MKKLITSTLLAILFGSTNAGESQGTVKNLIVHTPDIAIFSAGVIYDTPACNAAQQWAISMSDPVGKAMLAVLLTAQAQNRRILVKGYSGTCRDWYDRELPSYIILLD